MKERPVAVFDVDGTLYRSNLLVDLVYQLVRQGSFPSSIIDEFKDAQLNWKLERHRESYVNYIDQLIKTYVKQLKGLSVAEVQTAAKQIDRHSPGLMYVFGRDLIADIKDTHQLIAISGSPIEVVEPFVKRLGIDVVHATTFAISEGVYTGEVVHVGTQKKEETLKSIVAKMGLCFSRSVGIGDTDSDIAMLNLVERPIAFNPNKELFEHALKRKWEIIYERKDMILHLGEKGTFSVEDNFGHFRQNP